eukprot:scaffold174_cov99-Isochrysis_galbana.AAC.7
MGRRQWEGRRVGVRASGSQGREKVFQVLAAVGGAGVGDAAPGDSAGMHARTRARPPAAARPHTSLRARACPRRPDVVSTASPRKKPSSRSASVSPSQLQASASVNADHASAASRTDHLPCLHARPPVLDSRSYDPARAPTPRSRTWPLRVRRATGSASSPPPPAARDADGRPAGGTLLTPLGSSPVSSLHSSASSLASRSQSSLE